MENWDFNENNAMEQWDIFNENREKLNYTKPRKSHLKEGEYHLVVRIWIVNSRGNILLSKRNPNKRGGGLWECTGGSVLSGETPEQAVVREVKEELGIDLNIEQGRIVMSEKRDSHHDFYDIWLFRKDVELNEIIFDKDEVVDVKWVSFEEYKRMFNNNEVMPTLGFFVEIYEKFIGFVS